jgi:aminoglycoside phosphotransferase (APT) family kinase protein
MSATRQLATLTEQLTDFIRHHVADRGAEVANVSTTSGHAGFSYTFEVSSEGVTTPYFLRLPPAGVKLRGTADVLRQVCALRALDATDAPHARVVWSGEDERWFGMPYFVTEWVAGTTFDVDERVDSLSEDELNRVSRDAVDGLVAIRSAPWERMCSYLGSPIELCRRIAHWDRFYERAADRDTLLGQAPTVRAALLGTMPARVHVGLCHGDYQFGNLMYGPDRTLRAIIDWELCSVGPTLRDLGWLIAFHDRGAWGPAVRPMARRLTASELLSHLPENFDTTHLPWFEALALYEYAVISGFNLMLHRRGKRPDATWEWRSSSAPSNLARALEILEADLT